MTTGIKFFMNSIVMKSKKEDSLDKLKAELQVISREEMQKIKGGSSTIRFSTKWISRCEGRLPQ